MISSKNAMESLLSFISDRSDIIDVIIRTRNKELICAYYSLCKSYGLNFEYLIKSSLRLSLIEIYESGDQNNITFPPRDTIEYEILLDILHIYTNVSELRDTLNKSLSSIVGIKDTIEALSSSESKGKAITSSNLSKIEQGIIPILTSLISSFLSNISPTIENIMSYLCSICNTQHEGEGKRVVSTFIFNSFLTEYLFDEEILQFLDVQDRLALSSFLIKLISYKPSSQNHNKISKVEDLILKLYPHIDSFVSTLLSRVCDGLYTYSNGKKLSTKDRKNCIELCNFFNSNDTEITKVVDYSEKDEGKRLNRFYSQRYIKAYSLYPNPSISPTHSESLTLDPFHKKIRKVRSAEIIAVSSRYASDYSLKLSFIPSKVTKKEILRRYSPILPYLINITLSSIGDTDLFIPLELKYLPIWSHIHMFLYLSSLDQVKSDPELIGASNILSRSYVNGYDLIRMEKDHYKRLGISDNAINYFISLVNSIDKTYTNSCPLNLWSPLDLCLWLSYNDIFEAIMPILQKKIDGKSILLLTADELISLGFIRFLDRHKLNSITEKRIDESK